jgi:zinc protease
MDRALDVWAEVLLQPAFSEEDLARVREILLSTLARRKDSPPMLAGLTFARVLYGERHPYGWPASGTEESVRRLTRSDVQAFFQEYYRPNNAVLVVAGDIREAELRAKMEKLLAAWKQRPILAPRMPKAPPVEKTRVFLVDKAGAPQSSIRLGHEPDPGGELQAPGAQPARDQGLDLWDRLHVRSATRAGAMDGRR